MPKRTDIQSILIIGACFLATPVFAADNTHVTFRNGTAFTLTENGQGAFSNRSFHVTGAGMKDNKNFANITCSDPVYDANQDLLICAKQASPDTWQTSYFRGSKKGLKLVHAETDTQ